MPNTEGEGQQSGDRNKRAFEICCKAISHCVWNHLYVLWNQVSTPRRTLSAMTQDWTNYSLCCCISVLLMLRMIIKQILRLLFWLSSHSTLSAFISLTTHYPVSSPKTDEAILHNSEKWWEMTSSNSRAVLNLIYDYGKNQVLYQNWCLHFITCYAPKCKLKKKEKKRKKTHSNLRINSKPHRSLFGVSFFTQGNVIRKGQMKSLWWQCYGN